MGEGGGGGAGGAPDRGFHYEATPRFLKKLEGVRRGDPPGYERIRQVMERLLSFPGEADGMMHGEHRGKLKKYVGRADYRIIYNWCEICKKAGRHLADACPYCGSVPDHSVIFFDLFHKSEYRKLDY